MLDQPIDKSHEEAVDAVHTSPDSEEFYTPPQDARALNAPVSPPQVKRFNRTTVAVLGVTFAFVAMLALSTAFEPPKQPQQDPNADQTTKANNPSPAEAVSALPNNYSDVPRLGAPLPGDVGIIALDANKASGNPALAAQLTPANTFAAAQPSPQVYAPRPQTAAEQYQDQAQIARMKRQENALEGSLTFSGGAAGAQDLGSLLARTSNPINPAVGAAPAAPKPSRSARDDDNRQDDKSEFLNKDRDKSFALNHGVYYPSSPYTLLAGTIAPGVLETGINSDLPGQIEGELSQNVYDTVTGKYLLLPQGTKIIGMYDSRVTYGQERVLIVWTRMCRPDGSCIDLEGMPGSDLSGYAGLTGEVDHHYLRLLGGVLIGSIMGASSQIASGSNTQNPSFAQLATQGAGQNINQVGQQITRKQLAVQPTIKMHPGDPFTIFTTKDIVIPPYKG